MLRRVFFVVGLIVHLSLVMASRAVEPADASTAAAPAPSEGEAAVLAALKQPTTVDFDEQPLSDVADFLHHKHKLEIQFDRRALSDAGVGSDTPVTLKLDGIRLRSALRLILGELDLTYVARDGYLFITSKSEAENMLKIKTYPVRDLVTPPGEWFPPGASGEPVGKDYQSLIDLITSTVAPTMWDEVGGPGAMREFANSHAISFSQTEEVHEEAAELLAALRRVRDQQRAAVKALPADAHAEQAEQAEPRTYVYRLIPWPRNAPWMHYYTGAMGGGMGGGAYSLADEGANSQAKPADLTGTAKPPAEKPASSPKPAADYKDPSSAPAAPEWDTQQCAEWTKELFESLPSLVEPDSWQPRGAGSVRLLTGALVIHQTPDVHQKISRFLAELLPMRVVTSARASVPVAWLPVPGPQLDWPHEAELRPAVIEAQIEAGLAQKCDVEFRETPLAAAVQSLADQGHIKVWLHHRALTDAGVGTDTPITRSVHGVTIRAAFRLLLNELDLTYVIRNEILTITSKSEAESMLSTKVYPVLDLIAERPRDRGAHAARGVVQYHVVGMATSGHFSNYQTLIDNITSNIPPTTWDEVGGPGSIREFANCGALVISQTTEVHEEIAAFLRALRQAAAVQK